MSFVAILITSIAGLLLFNLFDCPGWILPVYSLCQILLLGLPSRITPLGIFTPTCAFILSFYLFHLPLGFACLASSYSYICERIPNFSNSLGMSFVSMQVYLLACYGLLFFFPTGSPLKNYVFRTRRFTALRIIKYAFPLVVIALILSLYIGFSISGSIGSNYLDIYKRDLNPFLRIYYSYNWIIPVIIVFIYAINPAKALILASFAIISILIMTNERSAPAFIFLFVLTAYIHGAKKPPVYRAILSSLLLLPISFIIEVGRLHSSNIVLGFLASGRSLDLLHPFINLASSLDTVGLSIDVFHDRYINSYPYHLLSIFPSFVWNIFVDKKDFPNLAQFLADGLILPLGTGKGFSILAESFVVFREFYWLPFLLLGILSWYYISICKSMPGQVFSSNRLTLILSNPLLASLFFAFLSLIRDVRSTVEISVKVFIFSYLASAFLASAFKSNHACYPSHNLPSRR